MASARLWLLELFPVIVSPHGSSTAARLSVFLVVRSHALNPSYHAARLTQVGL